MLLRTNISRQQPLALLHHVFVRCAPGTQVRDFTGAVTLLEFNRRSGEDEVLEDTLMWLGYCTFHLGSYQRAIDVYKVHTHELSLYYYRLGGPLKGDTVRR